MLSAHGEVAHWLCDRKNTQLKCKQLYNAKNARNNT